MKDTSSNGTKEMKLQNVCFQAIIQQRDNEHETFARSPASATGNITLKNIRDFAARGADIAVRGMAGLLDAARNSQPVSTQDRDKILGEIDSLSQQYDLTMSMEQKKALQKAKELLAFSLTQKR